MLDKTQQTLAKFRSYLLRQQKEVEEQIKSIEQDDPLMVQTSESSEPGTDSWQADVHAKVTTVKNDLSDFSKRIANSLSRINKGTYGKCEGCKGNIETERLEAMPTATLCLACSKKSSKRK